MKRKVLLVLFFVMTVFLSAEQFKGVLGFNLNDSKSTVESKAKNDYYHYGEENPNFFRYRPKGDYYSKMYATRPVYEIQLAFYEDKLVWIEVLLKKGAVGSSSLEEIIAGINNKYEFEKDLSISTSSYTLYTNVDTGVTFNCEEATGMLDFHDIEIRFCYLDKFQLFLKWEKEYKSAQKQKSLNDSI